MLIRGWMAHERPMRQSGPAYPVFGGPPYIVTAAPRWKDSRAMTDKTPTVFVSYAWEDDVKAWVRDFATLLRRNGGIDAKIDQWEVAPGDPLPAFMERAIDANDFVLVICTPKYKTKSDARQGGVGYEGHIITAELFNKGNHRKFIPVLLKGNKDDAIPTWLQGKNYLDFRDDQMDSAYETLLKAIHGELDSAPTIGQKPPLRADGVTPPSDSRSLPHPAPPDVQTPLPVTPRPLSAFGLGNSGRTPIASAKDAPVIGSGALIAGRYVLEEKLGAGGFGAVWRARDNNLDGGARRVAIKFLHEAFNGDPTIVARFQIESAALMAIRDPHVVDILDRSNGVPPHFLVMPYVEGEELKRWLERFPDAPPLDEVRVIFEQLCHAVQAAHEAKPEAIVHRDIKPANVILRRLASNRMHVTLVDFGVARVGDGGLTTPSKPAGLTELYAAPEQYGDLGTVCPQTDVFSLAVLLLRILTGKARPAPGVYWHTLASTENAPTLRTKLRELAPTLPGALLDVLARALQRDPGTRPPNAKALWDSLSAAWPGGGGSQPTPVTKPSTPPTAAPAPPPIVAPAPSSIAPSPAPHGPRAPSTPQLVGLAFLGAVVTMAILVGGKVVPYTHTLWFMPGIAMGAVIAIRLVSPQ